MTVADHPPHSAHPVAATVSAGGVRHPVSGNPPTPEWATAAVEHIAGALRDRLPCAVCHTTAGDCDCAPTDEQTRLLRARWVWWVLHAYGYLPEPAPEPPAEPAAPTAEDLDELAHWLADASGHVRFTTQQGWRRLRTYPTDVEMAYAQASRQATVTGPDGPQRLALARRVLLDSLRPAENGSGGVR